MALIVARAKICILSQRLLPTNFLLYLFEGTITSLYHQLQHDQKQNKEYPFITNGTVKMIC